MIIPYKNKQFLFLRMHFSVHRSGSETGFLMIYFFFIKFI